MATSGFDWIAGYGAVLATVHALIGFWHFLFKEPVKLRVTPNMIFFPSDGKTYVVANVINRHACAIYVTHYQGVHWKNHWQRIMRPLEGTYFVVNETSIPKIIEPGHYHMFMADMDALKKEYSQGILKMGIAHTMSDKPLLQYVSLREKKNKKTLKKINHTTSDRQPQTRA